MTPAKSLHEFGTNQGDLMREGIHDVVEGSRVVAEIALRAIGEAGKAIETRSSDAAAA